MLLSIMANSQYSLINSIWCNWPHPLPWNTFFTGLPDISSPWFSSYLIAPTYSVSFPVSSSFPWPLNVEVPRSQTPVFCSFFPPLLMVSYRYVVLNTINMPRTHIYISIPVSPFPWTLDSYIQLSVPYLQAQDFQTILLMCSPKLDVHATFPITIDGNSILSVAQPKNWYILDLVFLSHALSGRNLLSKYIENLTTSHLFYCCYPSQRHYRLSPGLLP